MHSQRRIREADNRSAERGVRHRHPTLYEDHRDDVSPHRVRTIFDRSSYAIGSASKLFSTYISRTIFSSIGSRIWNLDNVLNRHAEIGFEVLPEAEISLPLDRTSEVRTLAGRAVADPLPWAA
jgi:hypothetical protein